MPIEEFTKTFSISRAMVIEPDDLRRLDAALKSFCDEVIYEVQCGPTSMKLDLKSLLALDNPPSRPISRIRIRSPYNAKANCNVSLRGGGIFGGIDGQFTGKPSSVETICQKFEDFADHVKPWYSRITATNPVMVALALCAVLILLLSLLSALYTRKRPPEPVDPQAQSQATLFLFGGFALAVFVTWLKSLIFPDFIVTIGHGAKRHQTLEYVRWTVAIGVVVGTIGSLIATAIVALWSA